MVGSLASKLSSQKSLVEMHMLDLLSQPEPFDEQTNPTDDQYFFSILSRILSDIKQYELNEKPRSASIKFDDGTIADPEMDSSILES